MAKPLGSFICCKTGEASDDIHDEFVEVAQRCQEIATKLNSAFVGYVIFEGQSGHPLISFQRLPENEIKAGAEQLLELWHIQRTDFPLDAEKKKEYDAIREQFKSGDVDIAERLHNAEPIDAKILPIRAFFLVSLLQVALRHPALQHEKFAYETGMDMAKRLQAKLTEIHPQIGKILEMGWLPEYDHKYPIKTEEPS